ncbi:MAG: 5-(carboxyamino)imidazole ribonucleotide mutase [Candidatus Schekmanbacteria bacterium]|nr:MAG: 5-(carboxyamino)imidazole ribonucleotide mutase [Candidatus Schekmanbacteria bacterium]
MVNKKNIDVEIVRGSDSDFPIMETAGKVLKEFGISYRFNVISAHRTPEECAVFSKKAESRGVKVIIAGAGYAAHLAGVIASYTKLPVIGVPLEGSSLNGLDSLLSTVQMPGGVPVATMAIGKAGAKNAAFYAARIIALQNRTVKKKLVKYISDMKEEVRKKDLLIKKKK